jgi:mRNA interferase RelE/StbE
MKLIPKKPFLKDLKQIQHNKPLCRQIEQVLDLLESVPALQGIPHLQKIQGHPSAYRIRLGEYRLGLFAQEDAVVLARLLHRKEIYRYFPS